MFKKLFLSIIILSALASEGGAYLSADLIDYYLVNFARLDIMQDIHSVGQAAGNGVERKKGTPAAFFKAVSQNAIDLKNTIRSKYSDFTATTPLAEGLVLIIVFSICFNIKKSSYFRRYFLSLTDSSPPAACRI